MDALVLSEAITTRGSFKEAFEDYFNIRKHQIYYYYAISRLITPLFQSQLNLSFFRDRILPIFYNLPVTKKIIIETITGVRNSVFSTLDSKFYK